MPQNRDLYRRLYGEPPPRPQRDDDKLRAPIGGVLPLFYPLGLLVAVVASLAVALGALIVGARNGVSDLERWGVIDPDELILAVHDHSPARDGSAGCVVTGPRLVRWDDRKPTASVPLPGAAIEVDQDGVHASRDDRAVDCPFAPGDDPTAFALTARRWASVPR